MSIIAYKIDGNSVNVACDGRVMVDDEIVQEDKKKIAKPSDKLICGATGVADANDLWRCFVSDNIERFAAVRTTKEALVLAVEFKEMLIGDFHYGDALFSGFGGFFFITPHFHCAIYFSDDEAKTPHLRLNKQTSGCIGATEIYTQALIDNGVGLADAIRMSARKFTSINDNVYELSFEM